MTRSLMTEVAIVGTVTMLNEAPSLLPAQTCLLVERLGTQSVGGGGGGDVR